METTVSQVFCLYQFENKFIYAHNRDKKSMFPSKGFYYFNLPPCARVISLFIFKSGKYNRTIFGLMHQIQYDLRSRIHMCVPILVHLLSL